MPLGMPLAAKINIANIPHCRPGPPCRNLQLLDSLFLEPVSAIAFAGRVPDALHVLRDICPVGGRTPAGGPTSAHAPSSLSNSSTSFSGSHRLSLKASTKAP